MTSHWGTQGKCHLIQALKDGHHLVIESYVKGHSKWQKRPQYCKNLDLQNISEEGLKLWNTGVTQKVTNLHLSTITDQTFTPGIHLSLKGDLWKNGNRPLRQETLEKTSPHHDASEVCTSQPFRKEMQGVSTVSSCHWTWFLQDRFLQ